MTSAVEPDDTAALDSRSADDLLAEAACWAEKAAGRLQALFDLRRPRGLLASALYLTARTAYTQVPLPSGFVEETVTVAGARRRVARAEGTGRPLLIAPGLYASLNEALFVRIAAAAQSMGRPVLLVEDRFAPGTLALNPGPAPPLPQLAQELTALAARHGEVDVLALSAGTASALFLADAKVRRVVAWSSAFDPAAVLARANSGFVVRAYFQGIHARAFRRAGLTAPHWDTFVAPLGTPPLSQLTLAPLLLVHAEDDPVAPAAAVRALTLGPQQRALILPRGGHLGFGTLLGLDAYLQPFDD